MARPSPERRDGNPGTPASPCDAGLRALIEATDWAATPLGAMSGWPAALAVTVRVMLASPVPMCMLVGREGIMIYNDGFVAIAGARHPDCLGTSVLESWPEVAEFNSEVVTRVLGGEALTYEDQRFTFLRNGAAEEVWLDVDYSPVPGDDGGVVAVLALVHETTKRIAVENRLERSEERLSLALAASGIVGIWDWDVPRNSVTADRRFAEMYGVPPEEAAEGAPIGRFVEGVHPDDRDYVSERIEAALKARGDYRAEYRLRDAQGNISWVLAVGRVIADDEGRPARLSGVTIDISERKAAEAALVASEAKFRAIADTMPQMVWSTLPDGYHDYYNARWYEFTGVPAGSTDGEAWNGMFHPDDQERAREIWRRSLETGEPYNIEYRLRHRSGDYRWTLGRALPIRNAEGRIVRWFGTCTDIHEQKLAGEEREVVAQELSHRIKNIFSVLTGIMSLTARSHPEVKPFADALRARVAALGRAHDFVRPHSRASRPHEVTTSLHGLIAELVAPYQPDGEPRVTFTGEDPVIDDAAATPLALVFHELATNSAKYGALAAAEGRVEVESATEDELCRIVWRETGGAAIEAERGHEGFGTRLMSLSVEGQLAGTIARRWRPQGLEVDIVFPVQMLTRA